MKRCLTIILLNLLLITNAEAGLFEVQDIELLRQAKRQLSELKALYQGIEEQKKVLEKTQSLMQGHYHYSSLYDKSSLNQWRHSGRVWDQLLNGLDGLSDEALSEAMQAIANDFPLELIDKQTILPMDKEQAKLFELISKTTLANRASHTLAYNTIEDELSMLDSLQQEIEKSPNQKATLDLIARIQIEQAKLAAYQIKANAVNAELTSLQTQQDISDTKWSHQFFQWPEQDKEEQEA